MTTPHLPLTASLMAWPTGPGQAPTARRATRAWRADPVLADHLTPGHAALSLRSATGDPARTLLHRLASRAEPEARLAALAGLAPRLLQITGRWAAAGTPADDLGDLEADLVTGCWELLGSLPPDGTPEQVVAAAYHRVSGRRRTSRARATRHDPLVAALGVPASPGRTTVEHLVVQVVDLVATGRVTPTGAKVLVATAAGWPADQTALAVGRTPTAVRAMRSRVLRSLGEAS